MKFCNECDDKKMCNKCNNQINENKKLEAKLNDLKRHPPKQFGHMLLYYKIELSTFCTNSSII